MPTALEYSAGLGGLLAASVWSPAGCARKPCIAGLQIECACPGAAKGAQACLADGSGFGECQCGGPAGSGGLWCWGWNTHGQISDGTVASAVATPVKVL